MDSKIEIDVARVPWQEKDLVIELTKESSMSHTFHTKLASAYLTAKEVVIELGFASEIDWQHTLSFDNTTEAYLLQEAAWVILSSGMRESVVRTKFPDLSKAFFGWESADIIMYREKECREKALSIFRHKGKIDAIIRIAEEINRKGFPVVKGLLAQFGSEYIRQFPYMGPATALHLAKNIGLPVVKPDRHLLRIAKATGYDSPRDMCSAIAKVIGDKISVIDLVIWRYATLDRNYLSLFTI